MMSFNLNDRSASKKCQKEEDNTVKKGLLAVAIPVDTGLAVLRVAS
jgi:hypothetical protein